MKDNAPVLVTSQQYSLQASPSLSMSHRPSPPSSHEHTQTDNTETTAPTTATGHKQPPIDSTASITATTPDVKTKLGEHVDESTIVKLVSAAQGKHERFEGIRYLSKVRRGILQRSHSDAPRPVNKAKFEHEHYETDGEDDEEVKKGVPSPTPASPHHRLNALEVAAKVQKKGAPSSGV